MRVAGHARQPSRGRPRRARATWFVKRAADTADASKITIGVYNQKANIGPLRPAVGLQIDFRSIELGNGR
jgi:hypothetical protein